MRVLIPSQLRSYTHAAEVEGPPGRTLEELTQNLDARFSGIRFRIIDEQDRIRRHIRIFVNGEAGEHAGDSAPRQTMKWTSSAR